MKEKLLDLVFCLEADAWRCLEQAKYGSPVTSMSEDTEAGNLGRYMQKLAQRLREIAES
jgi:hypothetical protein